MDESTPPVVDRDPYERTDSWVETAFSAPYVTVEAHNAVYENPEFLDRVRPLLPDHIDQSPRALFTTGLSFSQPPPGGATERLLGIAGKYASREFERSLREDGLRGVQQVDETELRLGGRRRARAFGYDAEYPLAGGVGPLPVRVWAGIWATTDSFAMAGGIYPRDSLSVTEVGVTIEARPSGDRREVFDAIRSAAD